MSYVLDAVVMWSICDNDPAGTVELINDRTGQPVFRLISEPRDPCWGGVKACQANVAVGSGNYVDMAALGAGLREAAAKFAGFMHIAWQNEHDDGWTFATIRSGDGPYSDEDRKALLGVK